MKWALTTETMKTMVWCLVLTYAAFLIPVDAMAQNVDTDSGVMGGLLCGVAGWFTGSVGKGIATLAIVVIGIGALMGKVSWGMAIIVGLGVAIVFGAPTIVEELGGDSDCSNAGI